ncbi:MAG: trans-sulfuration enzyme family protein [Planctomycetota bacterium]|jgi:cystathionine beta-lyase/cystathionine gamma-synthase
MKADLAKDDGPDKAKKAEKAEPKMRTRLIHGIEHSGRWDFSHHVVPPMSASAAFRLESAERGAQGFAEFVEDEFDPKTHPPIYIYDRLDEPTRGMLEDNLALAEKGDIAVCFASGMAAISAAIGIMAKANEHIITHEVLYGCTYSLVTGWLPRNNISTSLIDLTDIDALREAIKPNTRIIYFETPVNPDLRLIDIRAVRNVVDTVNAQRDPHDDIRIVVDNTFASPFCQRPLEIGADVVCQSLTKSIGGFGTDMGGAVIGPRSLHRDLIMYRKDFGGSLSPKNAWPVLVQGLPTLPTRMVNYQKSAMRIARYLEDHPKVSRVYYPGLASFPQHELAQRQMVDEQGRFAPGSMIYFVLNDDHGEEESAQRFIDYAAGHAYCLTLAVSLGQVKTLIEAPYSMTHAAVPDEEKRRFGVVPGGIRISVGLEDWHDIIHDLEEGLAQV